MKQLTRRKKALTKAVIFIVVLLTTSFIMFFLLGKYHSTPAKEIVEDSRKPLNTPQHKNKISPESHKRPDEKTDGKVVYLTFDDGPSALTGQFLDVLKEHNIKATFFMQGSNLLNTCYQEIVKRAVKEGHYIGAHSMTHNSNELYQNKQFVPEMKETLALIYHITGSKSKLVRPPYGSVPGLEPEEIRNQIVDAGIKVWDWTIDSYDWKLKDHPDQIITNIKNQTTEKVEVILMHEKSQTLQALPDIIQFYKEQGYEFGVYNEENHLQVNFLNDQRI
ncbi:polysaccharide deacetylase family protein [Bacillus tuaregi]|uniref:polysaccharide deacetylase family protein n=1 Tax=Bacillus tuaregi TaxID=1816695 RepID=UPI0008F931D8|nr:polysaccharide deacetylase family protein [Bacillus tuaregi]